MKSLIAVSVILLLAIVMGIGYGQTTRTPQRSAIGARYELVPAKASYEAVDGTTREGSQVFLLDTDTGKVWEYQPYLAAETNGKPDLAKPPIHSAHFEMVSVDKLSP
jgi:hypothetical protein